MTNQDQDEESLGLQWLVDLTLKPTSAGHAALRMETANRNGRRHFSAIGRCAPLSKVRQVAQEIRAIEKEADDDRARTLTAKTLSSLQLC